MRETTLPATHFQHLYEARPDPWHLGDSAYERAKYTATLSALPRQRYDKALEVGCANGDFTLRLAPRCADLLAVEPIESAIETARRRCVDQPWVRFRSMFVPGDWPDETFDLVVVSEVIDYLGSADVVALSARVSASLGVGGEVILVHWIGKKSGLPTGDEASDRFIAAARGALAIIHAERNADYRIDLMRRVG